MTAGGAIQHVNSRHCLWPQGGGMTDGTVLVFRSGVCDEPRASFEWTTRGSLRHVASGLCIHPEGTSLTPADGSRLLLRTGCDALQDSKLKFAPLLGKTRSPAPTWPVHPTGERLASVPYEPAPTGCAQPPMLLCSFAHILVPVPNVTACCILSKESPME